jgi:hypothetical protein
VASPSAETRIYLTHMQEAVKVYAGFLVRTDQCRRHLCLDLATDCTEDLVDSPDIHTRITKQLVSSSVQKRSGETMALAARLDSVAVARSCYRTSRGI